MKNIKKSYYNNKLKIPAPTWNDDFELSNESYSTKYSRLLSVT